MTTTLPPLNKIRTLTPAERSKLLVVIANYTRTIMRYDREPLRNIMDRTQAQAKKNGLTPEILADILAD